LSENTVRKHTQIAKQFFTAAVRKKLIGSNPFTDLPSTVQANPESLHFVSRDDAQKVLDACPDAEWRLIFALRRFGGLRCPSEHLALTWDRVDWENSRIHIKSPKTEHHVGKAKRTIPIFPELRPFLEEAFDQARDGSVYVVSRHRNQDVNLRTPLLRIIDRAGLQSWPKLFQNLRTTRETELAEDFPMHVVCAWMGNSKSIAAKHYLQVTNDHFRQATEQVAQNPAQSASVRSVSSGQPRQETPHLSAFSDPDKAGQLLTVHKVEEEGLEPVGVRLNEIAGEKPRSIPIDHV
jgi:integrase